MAADVDQTAPIHAALAAKGLLPGDHLLDAGFVDVEVLVGSQFEHGVRLVGPMRPDVSWQAQANQGFDIAHFTIDWEAKRVTCPEGKTSVLWKPTQDRWGNEVIHAEFARRECQACPSRPLCTRATTEGREMTLRPREMPRFSRTRSRPIIRIRFRRSAKPNCTRRQHGSTRSARTIKAC